jgi:hypothetical protein
MNVQRLIKGYITFLSLSEQFVYITKDRSVTVWCHNVPQKIYYQYFSLLVTKLYENFKDMLPEIPEIRLNYFVPGKTRIPNATQPNLT